MSAIADVKPALDINPVGDQLIDFGEECIRIENHAVSDRASHSGVENAARNLVQDERLIADVHSMTRIRAALISHHPVGTLGQNIDELALPLVAPLRTDDDDGASLRIEHSVD